MNELLKYRITVEVAVDPSSVVVESSDGEIAQCTGCGDCYGSTHEFFEHQLGRDLQFIQIDPATLKVEKL